MKRRAIGAIPDRFPLWVLVPLAYVLISAALALLEWPRLPGEGSRGEPSKPSDFDPAGDRGRP